MTKRRRRRRWWSPSYQWRHRSSRRRRAKFSGKEQRLRKWRPVVGAAGVLAILGAVAMGVALHDLTKVRADLVTAKETMQRVVNDPLTLRTPQGRTAATTQMTSTLARLAGTRERLRRSIPITAAQVVPGLRGQREGMLALVDDVSTAATAGRNLLLGAESLADDLQVRDGSVPIDGIPDLQARVRDAGRTLGGLAGSAGGLWGPLRDARRDFDEVVTSSSRRLLDGAEALGAARTFLGAGGSRRYLVALQNNAEMRDQGAILSYLVIRFVDGRMTSERSGSVGDLRLAMPASTPLPEGTRAVFGPLAPTRLWQSVNATADFPLSGRSMVDMYRLATGESLDGVVALDVPGLAAILRVVGPVNVEGVATPINAENVGRLLLHDFYVGVVPTGDQTARRERQADVMQAVLEKLTTGQRDAVRLGTELGAAAAGGHLRLWSTAEGEEQVFERVGLGGGPATRDADRTFHFALENRTANKVDYYVTPTVRQVVELTDAGSAVVTTTVTIKNGAPVGETKPSYQLGPADEFSKKPGDYIAWALLWGPAGSNQLQGGIEESGLNLSQFVTPVDAGQQREVVFQTVIPDAVRDGRLEIRLVPQPRLFPVPLEIRLDAPEWRVDGEKTWQGPWDRVRTFSWEVRRG